jgi:hypothetical protein
MPTQDNKDNSLQIEAASFFQKLNINRQQKCKAPIINLKLLKFIYTKLATSLQENSTQKYRCGGYFCHFRRPLQRRRNVSTASLKAGTRLPLF